MSLLRAIVLFLLVADLSAAQAAPARPPDAQAQALMARAAALFDADAILRRRDGRIVIRENGRHASPGAVERDRRAARDLLRQASERGDPTARQLYAQMLEAGAGGGAQPAIARQLYAESGTRVARWRLGRMLEAGWGGPRDITSARRLYRLASNAGQVDARYDLARLLRAGLGGKRDAEAARALLTSMTDFCHAEAADDLAAMAERGEGGPRDVELAATHYLRAAQCRSDLFATPAMLSRWATLDLAVRIATQRRLVARGYAGPQDGAWRREMAKLIAP